MYIVVTLKIQDSAYLEITFNSKFCSPLFGAIILQIVRMYLKMTINAMAASSMDLDIRSIETVYKIQILITDATQLKLIQLRSINKYLDI